MTLGQRKTVMCLMGTRPEAIKLAPVIEAFAQQAWARTLTVTTGQHRELVHQTLAMFNLAPDADLDVMTDNQTLAGLSARVFERLDALLVKEQPSILLVQGDTTSAAIAALAAFYRKIPVGHVEAGLRTGDLHNPFPEELNRVIAGRIAALHFAPTAGARANLLAERIPDETIFVTGNTVIDALKQVAKTAPPANYPKQVGRRLILVTAHRRESFGAPLRGICQALRDIHDEFSDVELVYPVHPNPQVREPVFSLLGGLERLHLIEPADYRELISLMKACTFVLTDSGGIQEEAPALAKPVLVLRAETERPEAVEAGVAKLIGSDPATIVRETRRLLTDPAHYAALARGASPYGDGHAAPRIVKACADYLGVRTHDTVV